MISCHRRAVGSVVWSGRPGSREKSGWGRNTSASRPKQAMARVSSRCIAVAAASRDWSWRWSESSS
ncbi:hypothetical protein ACFFX0_31445 [Citricoccus parietis]|uniref:Uncharacterized protein n=1 Tax=Citricoccus parietis TaxID=592307 RepID=A0ABV5G929_9MICC